MPENTPIETFGFEKEEIKGGVFEKYKGKKGEVHRVGIIFTDPKAMFSGAQVHFKDRYFVCKKSVCCDKCGPAKWRVGSVLIKYTTDRLGAIKQPFSYEILPWQFSEGTFVRLKSLNNEFPLTTHDIKIACTNDDFQHLDITPCNESIWQMKPELKAKVLEEAKPIWDYTKKGIAGNLSLEEIKELIGIAPSVGTDPTSKLDLDGILEQA